MISQMFVDNTTFAATGRVLHYGDMSCVGGKHAADYYRAYQDARDLDRTSFLEFLTALLLFDQIVWWNGSSDEDEREWVYDWFPLLREANEDHNAIDDISRLSLDEFRIETAREIALKWTNENYKKFSFPRGFRVPIAYQVEEYYNRQQILELQDRLGLRLTEEMLQVAMFLQRGIFYQSECLQQPGFSYLPHSYRACLLSHPRVASLSLLCTRQLVKPLVRMGGDRIMKEIDAVFAEEVESTFGLSGLDPGEAIVSPFLQNAHQNPKEAFIDILEFRESRAGHSIRKKVRELVSLGDQSNKKAIEKRLAEIRSELQAVELRKFGHASRPREEAEALLGLIEGRLRFTLRSLWSIVPIGVQERLSKIAHTTIRPSGFQVVFGHYFPSN